MAFLKQYLKKKPKGKSTAGMKGKESEWLDLASFDLKGKRFLISDAGYMGSEEDGVSVAAKPGKYQVQVKMIDFGADRRISRLRASLAGVKEAELKKVGEAWADVGRIGFSDGDALLKLGKKLESDELIDALNEALGENEEKFGTHRFGEGGPEMIYVDSGFGDGTFPVYQLKTKGANVGFEVEFIEPSAKYPFGDSGGAGDLESDFLKGMASAVGVTANDPVMEALGQLLGQMKEAETGDREKDRAKFKELSDKQENAMRAGLEKEMAEYRKTRTDLRRQTEPWTDELEPKFEIGLSAKFAAIRDKMVLGIDQALFMWPRTLGKKLSVDLDAVVENLVIVFDGERPEELVMQWWCATGDYSTREEEFTEGDAIQAFARVNKAKGSPLEFICRKAKGLKAEYFLRRNKG
jgi:hypothetical protein